MNRSVMGRSANPGLARRGGAASAARRRLSWLALAGWAALGSAPPAFGAQSGMVINEIHYDPDVKTEPVEFIELFNAGSNTVDLSGWQLSEGVSFTFPAGSQIHGVASRVEQLDE